MSTANDQQRRTGITLGDKEVNWMSKGLEEESWLKSVVHIQLANIMMPGDNAVYFL